MYIALYNFNSYARVVARVCEILILKSIDLLEITFLNLA